MFLTSDPNGIQQKNTSNKKMDDRDRKPMQDLKCIYWIAAT